MRLVIIESPYKGDVERNLRYLRSCIRDCIYRGESPYASHRMLTDALDDNDPKERELGISAGHSWREAMFMDPVTKKFEPVLPVFYVDLDWSPGMVRARALYDEEDIRYELRTLPADDSFFTRNST